MKILSATEAAKRLGLSRQRVHLLVQQGRIKAARIGHAWTITERALAEFAKTRPRNR